MTGRPAAFCFGPGHVVVYGNPAFISTFGEAVVAHYLHTAEWEQFEYDRRVTDWELKRGFERS